MFASILDGLAVRRIDASYEVSAGGPAPAHLGAWLHGALARSIDEVAPEVAELLFSGALPPDRAVLRLYERGPHPFALRIRRAGSADDAPFEAGERIDATIHLFGRAADEGAWVARALEALAAQGIGPERSALSLCALRAGATAPLRAHGSAEAMPSTPCRAEVITASPLRIASGGEIAKAPPFAAVVRSLLARCGALLRFHAGAEPALDFAALAAASRRARVVEAQWTYRARRRRSRSNGHLQALSGVEGRAVYEGVAHELGCLLSIGEVIQVGKGTAFGLGAYEWRLAA